MTDLVKELDECAKRQLSCAPSYIPKCLEYLAAREIETLTANGRELVRWKRALENEAVITFTLSDKNKDDPHQMLMDVINWHVAVALDPKVNGGYSLVKVDQPEESDDGKGTQDF